MVKAGRYGLSFLKITCRGCRRHLVAWFVAILCIYSIFYLSQNLVENDNIKLLHRINKAEFKSRAKSKNEAANVPTSESSTEFSWGNVSGLMEHIKPQLLKFSKERNHKSVDGDIVFPWDDRRFVHQNKACRKPYIHDFSKKVSLIINLYGTRIDKALCSLFHILKVTDYHLVEDVLLVGDIGFPTFYRDMFDLFTDYLPSFRFFILPKRSTAIQNYKFAAKFAHGDFLVFMDLNVMFSDNWLEYIVNAIMKNPTKIVQPLTIRNYTVFDAFGRPMYMQKREVQLDLSLKEYNISLSPFHFQDTFPKQAVVSSSIFALKKTLYFDLRELEDYSGESDLEMIVLSLKAWTCGDGVIVAPCSQVVEEAPFIPPSHQRKQNTSAHARTLATKHKRNVLYVSAAWLGSYDNAHTCLQNKSRQLRLTYSDKRSVKLSKLFYKRLGCGKFSDFVRAIQPSLLKPVINTSHYGALGLYKQGLFVSTAHGGNSLTFVSNTERDSVPFMFSNNTILFNRQCFTYIANGNVRLAACQKKNLNQKWTFINGQFHLKSKPRLCLGKLPAKMDLRVNPCNSANAMSYFNFTFTFVANCIK